MIVNGSEANGLLPDPNFTFTIAKGKGKAKPATAFFKVAEPMLEHWNFTWYEGMFGFWVSSFGSAGVRGTHVSTDLRLSSRV